MLSVAKHDIERSLLRQPLIDPKKKIDFKMTSL
jgi:hypothetical protein